MMIAGQCKNIKTIAIITFELIEWNKFWEVKSKNCLAKSKLYEGSCEALYILSQ